MTMTDAERQEFLASLNLTEQGKAAPAPAPTTPTGITFPADAKTMPVSDITFDPAWIDGYADLTPGTPDCKAAYDLLFRAFRSDGKNPDRHGLLHRRINGFIASVRRTRMGGDKPVTEQIKADRPARDLAAWLVANGITAADVAAALGITTTKED